MKKLMMTIAGLLFVSVMAVNAQVTQDTTQVPADQPAVTEEPQPSEQLQPDMERVEASDVPASLRSTLQGNEYRGWEDGTIYRNTTTNEYSVEIGEGTDKKTFRFDANGKRIDEEQGDQ